MNYKDACKYSDYLLLTGQEFCWLENGEFITREECDETIDKFNTID